MCVVFSLFRLRGRCRLFVRLRWFGRCPRGWRCVRCPVRGSFCGVVVAAVLLVASSLAVALLRADLRGWAGGFSSGGVCCVGACCWFSGFVAVVAVVACSRFRLRCCLLVVFVPSVAVPVLCCCAVPVAAVGCSVPVACSWCSALLASVASGWFCGVGSVGLLVPVVVLVAVVAVVLPVVFAGVRLGWFARCSRSAAASVLLSVAVSWWRPLLIVACLLGAGFLPVPFFYVVTTCAGEKKFGELEAAQYGAPSGRAATW